MFLVIYLILWFAIRLNNNGFKNSQRPIYHLFHASQAFEIICNNFRAKAAIAKISFQALCRNYRKNVFGLDRRWSSKPKLKWKNPIEQSYLAFTFTVSSWHTRVANQQTLRVGRIATRVLTRASASRIGRRFASTDATGRCSKSVPRACNNGLHSPRKARIYTRPAGSRNLEIRLKLKSELN